jgi:glycosyltransferase involved in cell wall biosynthesis
MKLRILLLCPSMHPREGGPPRVVYGSALALARAGVAVEIATIGSPEDDAETRGRWPKLVQSNIPLHIYKRDFPWVIGRSRALNRFLREEGDRFDLVHIHCVWETCLADGAAIFRRRGKPSLISAHGMLDRWQLQQSGLKKALAQCFLGTGSLLRKASALIYGTQDEASEASALALPGRAVIIPNGVDPADATNAIGDARERFLARVPEIREWQRTVLFFSRLHPKKGLDLLVEAFGRVHNDFPGTGLLAAVIPQDEEYGAAVHKRIAELQPAKIVLASEPSGFDPNEVFANAEIFCLPSHQEGFSMAIIQAAVAGLPQLITDKCHLPEIEIAGAGLVVPDTVDGIERGLRELLAEDNASLVDMGRRARQFVVDNYTWDRIAERLIAAYEQEFSTSPHGRLTEANGHG